MNLQTLYRQLNRQYFGGLLKDVPVEWNSRLRRSAGRCHYDIERTYRGTINSNPHKIDLNPKMLSQHPARLKGTLLHEMTHVHLIDLCGDPGHGNRFQAIMTSITGVKTDHSYHDYYAEVTSAAEPYRWKTVCRKCGLEGLRKRLPYNLRKGVRYNCINCQIFVEFHSLTNNTVCFQTKNLGIWQRK